MLAGYWLGKVLGNAVLGLSLGVLLGMLLGSKIKRNSSSAVGYRHIFKIYAQINVKSYYLTEAPAQKRQELLISMSKDGLVKYTFFLIHFSFANRNPSPKRWKWTTSRALRNLMTSFTSGSSESRRMLS